MLNMLDHRPLVPKEIDGLLVPPGKAYMLLTGHLITGLPPAQESGFKSILMYKPLWLTWMVIFQALVMKRLDITIVVGWDAKPQLKQTLRYRIIWGNMEH